MKMQVVGSAAFMALVIQACGGKSHSRSPVPADNDAPADSSNNVPATVDEFTPEQQAQLAAWKNALFKSCSYSEAMPWLQPDNRGKPEAGLVPLPPSVDLTILAGKLGQSSVVTGSKGEFAYFDKPVLMTGDSSENRSFSITVNGISSGFTVKAVQTNDTCVLSYGGVVIHETRLAKSQPVSMMVDATTLSQLAEARSLFYEMKSFNFKDQPAASSERVGRSIGFRPLVNRIQEVLGDSSRRSKFVAEKLDITEAQATQYFPATQVPTPMAFALGDDPKAALADGTAQFFGAFGPEMVNLDKDSGHLNITAMYPLVDWLKGETTAKPYRFRAGITLKKRVDSIEGPSYETSVSSFQPDGSMAYNTALASDCFVSRHALLTGFLKAQNKLTNPIPFAPVATACQIYTDSLPRLLAEEEGPQAILKDVIAKLKLNAAGTGYSDWNTTLKQAAAYLDQQKKSLTNLVPATALANFEEMASLLNTDALRSVYRPQLLNLALDWFFTLKTPNTALMQAIKGSLQNVGQDFVGSVQLMLKDLGGSIAPASAGVTAAECGAGFTAERIQQFNVLAGQVDGLMYLKNWSQEARESLLKNCWSPEDFVALQSTASKLKDWFESERPQLTAIHNVYDLDAAELGKQAMTERWTQESFEVAGQLAGYAAVSSQFSYCASTTKLKTSILRCAGIRDAVHARAKGLLFKRYGELATSLAKQQTEWLADSAYFSVRFAIEQAFFDAKNPLWGRCSQDQFQQKAQAQDGLLQRYRQSTNFSAKFQLQQDIEANLKDCP